MQDSTSEPTSACTSAEPGKYLTFELCGTAYGVRIFEVREIIGTMEVTPVPRTPDFVLGVMNLRGKIIPVLDLRRVLRMEPRQEDLETRIIVATGWAIHSKAWCTVRVLRRLSRARSRSAAIATDAQTRLGSNAV